MKIAGAPATVLLDPDLERAAMSSAEDRLPSSRGRPERIGRARMHRSAGGRTPWTSGSRRRSWAPDPLDPVAAWNRLYRGTALTVRRGAAVHALDPLDMALWDLCGTAA